MQKAIIVDIDGTVAKNVGRGFHDYHRVHEDEPHLDIISLINSYSFANPDVQIIFVSGRPDSCRESTMEWLRKHNLWPDRIFMRRTGDYRKDFIIKKELYDEWIADHYDIQFVIDDRNQVVDMWRSIGLRCIQVAPGDF